MITALRTRASDFELKRGVLTHAPSDHNFRFDQHGNVTVDAHCDCALLAVAPEQREELWQAFQVWRHAYWRPVEINRQFAEHFRAPGVIQRVLRRLGLAWRRATRARFDDGVGVAANEGIRVEGNLAPAE
jgi:formate-dependent nitrite reductase cytochrome c552 subunit